MSLTTDHSPQLRCIPPFYITEHVERVTRHGLVHNVVIHAPPDYNRIPPRKEENKKENIHVQSVVFVVRNHVDVQQNLWESMENFPWNSMEVKWSCCMEFNGKFSMEFRRQKFHRVPWNTTAFIMNFHGI